MGVTLLTWEFLYIKSLTAIEIEEEVEMLNFFRFNPVNILFYILLFCHVRNCFA